MKATRGTQIGTRVDTAKTCACGASVAASKKRCNPCDAKRKRLSRSKTVEPSIAVVIECDGPPFTVSVRPNIAAQADGWGDKEYGPFDTFEAANAKARFVLRAIDVWNECSGVANA